jgi:hypothetical protein
MLCSKDSFNLDIDSNLPAYWNGRLFLSFRPTHTRSITEPALELFAPTECCEYRRARCS